MKVAIFGYPRSGTTMLKDIIVRHLVEAGLIEPDQNLGEPFNPLDHTLLVPFNVDDYMHVKAIDVEPRDIPMTREQRFELFKKAHGDYVLKMLSQDTLHPPILPYLVESGYHFVCIERRNHFAALMSWLVAWNSHKWGIRQGEERPAYEPFRADMNDVAVICRFMTHYFRYRQSTGGVVVRYEDMCDMTPEALLRSVGLFQEGVAVPPTEWTKMHSDEQKAALIENLDEVWAYYQTTPIAFQ